MSDELLTVDDVAELFQTTPQAIRAQRYRGNPPFTLGVKAGARIFWRRSDIDAWFAEQVAAITEQAEGADR